MDETVEIHEVTRRFANADSQLRELCSQLEQVKVAGQRAEVDAQTVSEATVATERLLAEMQRLAGGAASASRTLMEATTSASGLLGSLQERANALDPDAITQRLSPPIERVIGQLPVAVSSLVAPVEEAAAQLRATTAALAPTVQHLRHAGEALREIDSSTLLGKVDEHVRSLDATSASFQAALGQLQHHVSRVARAAEEVRAPQTPPLLVALLVLSIVLSTTVLMFTVVTA